MKNTKNKPYIILGIGVGIILTTTIYSIFPKVEYSQMTDEMVIERAKELGMVGLKESIKNENTTQIPDETPVEEPQEETTIKEDEVNTEIINDESSSVEDPKEIVEEPVVVEEKPVAKVEQLPVYPKVVVETPVENLGAPITFVIETGDTLAEVANSLKDKGLITDTMDFIIYVKSLGLDKKLRVGSYEIRENSSYKDIINIITKKAN